VFFSGDIQTGLFTTGTGDVSISAAGADQVDVDSGGLHVNNDAQIAGAEIVLPAPVGSQPPASLGPETFTIVMSAQTTTASRTAELTIDGNAVSTSGPTMNILVPPNNTSWSYTLNIVGMGGGDARNIQRRGIIRNVGGAIAWGGPTGSTEINDMGVADAGASSWTFTQSVPNSGRLNYKVYQGASTTYSVNWTARLEITAVTQP
jgi:hypothetical protein